MDARAATTDFHKKFTENPDGYVDSRTDILEDGIEQGVFNDVDPERTASFLLTIVDGIIVEATTRTVDPREEFWESLSEYIETHVVAQQADTEFASWRQRPGRLTTGGTQHNADPRLTTGSPGDHPFFPSRPWRRTCATPTKQTRPRSSPPGASAHTLDVPFFRREQVLL